MRVCFRTVSVLLAALCLLTAPGIAGLSGAADALPDSAIVSTAARLAEAYDLPLSLLLAVCQTESGFDPYDGNGTCEGLMGLHRQYAGAYAREAGLDGYDLYDISDNLTIGAYILAGYYHTYDLHMALMCYNLGETGAKAARRDGAATTRYSRLVVERMAQYEDLVPVEAPPPAEAWTQTLSLTAGAPQEAEVCVMEAVLVRGGRVAALLR